MNEWEIREKKFRRQIYKVDVTTRIEENKENNEKTKSSLEAFFS